MVVVGLLIGYTIFVLFVRRAAIRLWREAREHGTGALAIRWPRLADVGWGAALIPVTALYLAIFGAFTLTDQAGRANLFSATTLAGSLFFSLLTLMAVTGYTLARPRRAGYLAAVGLTGAGCWVLFEGAAFPHYVYDYEWYGWLRDQLYIQELALLGLACVAGGLVLTGRTIVPDTRARRNGLTAQVERLTRTRADAVDAAAAELRRLERDLHDGAQARLVALGINLRTAERLIDSSPDDARILVAECRESSARALAELRDLVRGVYPPVLADRGLGDAIRALALDCPVLTLADVQLPGRPPAPVESAVYFAVAETLNNAVKHAHATTLLVRLSHARGMLRAEIQDDGIGGADPAAGSPDTDTPPGVAAPRCTGLAGMERRLATFDGILAVSSPIGGPTIVIIEVPCALSSPKSTGPLWPGTRRG
jgi:signal transduction histidine kinase